MVAFRSNPVVVGVGACTSIGASHPASAVAVRAGITGFGNHPFMVDTAGKPMIVAAAPYLSATLAADERWLALAMGAASEALAALPQERVKGVDSIPLLVGLPEGRPGPPRVELERVVDRLGQALSKTCPIGATSTLHRGHSAGLLALLSAAERIDAGMAELCLIGGIECALHAETLEWIESCGQLHSAGESNNAWGYIPAEAAGFCLIASRRMARQLGLLAKADIVAIDASQEDCLIKTEAVCTGKGLTRTFMRLFDGMHPNEFRVDNILCDMNGEPYRAEEYAFASLRTDSYFADSSHFIAPADCWGDVGAASGPLLVGLAVEGHAKGYLAGSRTLVWTSSEGGDRAAAIIGLAGR
jgi:3-oxoacyl-[acyl-carrier-protein] synthase-1